MKKRVFALFLPIVLILTLTGCHGSKSLKAFELPEKFDAESQYEITFWAKNDTNKTQVQIYEKAIDDFEALYPNITVNLRLYTDYGKIYNDVITNISTQTTPNVCITYPDHIATYMTGANVVVPLDSLMNDGAYGFGGNALKYDAPLASQMIEDFMDECQLLGNFYAIPFMRSTEALYINETLLNKMGYEIPDEITWDFVWKVSEEAMEKDDSGNYVVNGQNVMIPFIYKSTDNMLISMLAQKKADYSNSEGDILIFNDTTKELLYEISDHAKSGAFSTFKISSYPGNFLNAGQCIFAIDSTAGATWMGTNAPNSDIAEDKIVEFEMAVREIPQFDYSNEKMMSQGPSICIFNKENPQEVLASWLFAQYLLTNDVQIAYAQTEGYVPVTHKAQESEEYLDYAARAGEDDELHYKPKIEASKLLVDKVGSTFTTPVFNGSTSLRDASSQMVENVCKSVRRKETVDEAYMEKLQKDMVSLYRLDQTKKASGDDKNDDMGDLPFASTFLLISLVVVWALIAIYAIRMLILKKRLSK